MILIIKKKRYQTRDLGKVPISVHRQVQAEFGMGWATIQRYMNTIEGAQIGDLIGVPEFEAWMLFWILAGHTPMTRADIDNLTLDDIDFEQPDEVEQPGDVVETLPTSAPTDSDRGDVTALPKRAPSKRQPSTTSRRKSANG